jgi:hypothetical protein
MRLDWVCIAVGCAGLCSAAEMMPGVKPAVSKLQRIQLTTLVNPPYGAIGLILKARVDGSPMLRLLLDSGAEHLVLSRSAAQKAGHSSGVELDLVGMGEAVRGGQLTTAHSVQAGALEFRDCEMVIAGGRVGEGIDGAIPLSIFTDSLIRLDLPGKVLELEPYPSERQQPCDRFVRAVKKGNMLLVRGQLPHARAGYMLLDTGSSYNVLDNSAKDLLPRSRVMPQTLSINAAGGQSDARWYTGRVALKAGGGDLMLEGVVAMDLAGMSRRQGIDLIGVIGYPALTGSVITVNYRDGLVGIQPK